MGILKGVWYNQSNLEDHNRGHSDAIAYNLLDVQRSPPKGMGLSYLPTGNKGIHQQSREKIRLWKNEKKNMLYSKYNKSIV